MSYDDVYSFDLYGIEIEKTKLKDILEKRGLIKKEEEITENDEFLVSDDMLIDYYEKAARVLGHLEDKKPSKKWSKKEWTKIVEDELSRINVVDIKEVLHRFIISTNFKSIKNISSKNNKLLEQIGKEVLKYVFNTNKIPISENQLFKYVGCNFLKFINKEFDNNILLAEKLDSKNYWDIWWKKFIHNTIITTDYDKKLQEILNS